MGSTMTDKTTHKPGCEALGGYGHGVGPCSCSEAQPGALELADRLIGNAQIDECEGCNPVVVDLERAAATELRRQHGEIQQLKAQLSARQAALDGWRIALERIADPRNTHFAGDAQIVARDALSAAPPPPEREPQQDMFPMQPVVLASDGKHRFNENRIVRRLVDHGRSTGYGLNEIAWDYAKGLYSVEEQMQLAQLIGYSVYGYGTLSYVTDESYERAAAMAERLTANAPIGASNDNP